MSEQTTGPSLDARVEELRQKILALPPADYCGHFSSDINGNCMTCQREESLRVVMMQAWWLGHRDVCTDCNCPDDRNPYSA